jgi:hypothetical protein
LWCLSQREFQIFYRCGKGRDETSFLLKFETRFERRHKQKNDQTKMAGSIFCGLPNDLIIKIVKIGQREAVAKETAKKVSAPFRAGPICYHNGGEREDEGRSSECEVLPDTRKIQTMLEKANRVWEPQPDGFEAAKYTTAPIWEPRPSFDFQANQGDGRRLSGSIHAHIKAVGRNLHTDLRLADHPSQIMKPIQKKNKFKMMKELLASVPQAQTPDEFLMGESQVPRSVQWEWSTLWNRTICYSFQDQIVDPGGALGDDEPMEPNNVRVLCWRHQKNEMRSPSPDLKSRCWLVSGGLYPTMSQPIIRKSKAKWKKIHA